MLHESRPCLRGVLLALLLGVAPFGARADTIFLARRGWHIDIGFASAELLPPMTAVAEQFPGARYVFFGFGDRRYLESQHHGVVAMIEALWPGDGLLLVTGLSTSPEAAFGATHVLRFDVSAAEASATQQFVWDSFSRQQAALLTQDAAGSGTRQAGLAGPYVGSVYFGARPTYSAGHTCNTWAAEALAVSRRRIRASGVLFAGQLWRQAVQEQARGERARRQGGAP